MNEPLLSKDAQVIPGIRSGRMNQLMRELRDWDPFANKVFKGHTGPVWCCAMTSDNLHIFSGAEDKTVKIWEASTQRLLGELTDYTNTVNGLEVTKDDQYLISGDWSGNLFVHNWRERTLVTKLVGHTAGIYTLAISSDGRFLATGSGDYTAKIWDMESYEMKASLNCDGNSVFGLAITTDGKEIFCGGWGGVVRVFNFENYSLITSFDPQAGVVQCLTVTRDNKYVVLGTRNNLVKVYNRADKTEYCSFNSHQNWVRNIVATIDSTYFITVSADKTIRIFHIPSKSEEINLEGSEGYVFGEYISKDGQYLLTGASDKIMRLWVVGKFVKAKKLKGHTKCIMSLAVTKDNKFVVTGSEDKSVRIWNIELGTQVAELNGHTETVWAVTVTNSMRHIVSASGDKSVAIWDFHSQDRETSLTGHANSIFCVAVTADDKYIVTGAQDKNIIVWDFHKRELVKVLEGHTDTVFTVKTTNDNKFVISGAADYTIRIWDLVTLAHVQKFETKAGMIESVSISHNDKYLALGDRSNSVHLWDWHMKKPIKKFTHHTKWVKSVNFSPDGNLFASASNDMTVRLWNANEERHEQVLMGHTGTIRSVAFTSDNKHVLSAGEDLSIIIWDVSTVENMQLADIGSSIDSFLYGAKIKTKAVPSLKNYRSVFSGLKVNLAHIYSYLGYDDLLKKALELGTEIRIDTDGHSPLYYALERSTQSCIDAILKYMVELKEENLETFLNYGYALRGDFASIMDNRSVFLPEFLEAIFYSVQNVTNFAVPKETLPILKFNPYKALNTSLFVFDSAGDQSGLTEVPVEFKTLPFKIDFESGSAGSIDILDSIANCPNQKILTTELIRLFIRNKWNNLWPFILLTTILMWSNILLMVIILILSTYEGKYTQPLSAEYFPLVVAFFVVNILLTIYEIVQAFSTGLSYFCETWNLIDITRFSLSFLWGFLVMVEPHTNPSMYYITWLLVIFNFFRSLTGFKAFDSTRFYTRLIFRAFGDAIAFVLVFFYSTFAFGVLNYASMDLSNPPEGFTLFNLWQSPYDLNMGNFDVKPESLQYVYFLFASVVNVIVMLNLLISILGDSFESFQSEATEIDCLEMTETIIEIETLMFWKRGKGQKQYLQICKALEVAGTGDWEGKMKAIYGAINEMRKENRNYFKIMISKIDSLAAKN